MSLYRQRSPAEDPRVLDAEDEWRERVAIMEVEGVPDATAEALRRIVARHGMAVAAVLAGRVGVPITALVPRLL